MPRSLRSTRISGRLTWSTRRKPKTSLETFRRIRGENYELIERAGNHTERGRETLRQLLEGYAGHAESHARQLQEILNAGATSIVVAGLQKINALVADTVYQAVFLRNAP